jgi:hypothetical protein
MFILIKMEIARLRTFYKTALHKRAIGLALFPMKNIKYHKQIYMHADLNFKLVID